MGGKQSGAHVDKNPVVVEVSQLRLDLRSRRQAADPFRGHPKSTLSDRVVFKGKWRWDKVRGEFVERET